MPTTSTTPTTTPTERTGQYKELDYESEALAPYWPSRIDKDLTWHGHKTQPGHWFLEPDTGTLLTITTSDVYTTGAFTITAAPSREIDTGDSSPAPEPVFEPSEICGLAALLEDHYLLHIPPHTTTTVGDRCIYTTETRLLVTTTPESVENPRELPITPDTDVLPRPGRVYSPTITPSRSPDATTAPPGRRSAARFGGEVGVQTRFINCPRPGKWTFETKVIRDWVEDHLQDHPRVLNATAGQTHLRHPDPPGEIVRNDSNPDRIADTHVDVAELANHYPENSFDAIVFDPPWSLYQANLRYDGHHVTKSNDGWETSIDLNTLPFELDLENQDERTQLGHARLAKENFDYLLKPGGIVIELSYQASCMPSRMGYEQIERTIFNPVGQYKPVIGSIDQNIQTGLAAFTTKTT